MGEKRGRSSSERIAQLESMPVIYGSISSGAIPQFMKNKEYSILSKLTEGGFAKDISLKKDTVRERITIENNM